jgi:hypothetical protein
MFKQAITNYFAPLFPMVLGQIYGMDSGSIGTWMIAAAALAVIVNQIASAIRIFRGKPVGMEISENCMLMHAPIVQRLDTLEHDEQRARAETNSRLSGVSVKITDLRTELKTDMAAMQTQAKASDRNLHDRMNVILEKMSELKGAFEQSQRRAPQ